MSKLFTKKIISFFAMTLTFAMCFANIALASDNPPVVGNPIMNPGEITIDKTLRMPIGTTTPDADFNFLVSKVSLDGSSSNTGAMPDLNTNGMSVSYKSTDTEDPDASNTISITKPTADIFDGVNFTRAGVYEYEISEEPGTNDEIDDNAPYESLTYSPGVYTLRVYVANNDNNTGTEIEAVSLIVKTPDNNGQTAGHKVDKMVFTNDYVKTNGPTDPEKPDPTTESTLSVSNTVGGNYGDTTQYFDFAITPVVHDLYTAVGEFFRAYIVEGNTVVDDITANIPTNGKTGTDGENQNYIEIATSGETSFKLKHGQKLVFVDTPVGTSYTVDMTLINNYAASFTVTTNDMQTISGSAGASDTVLSTEAQFVGELKNSADFTNLYDDSLIVPTGINMNNVPFIGIILLPLIALVLFIAFKTRRNKETNL